MPADANAIPDTGGGLSGFLAHLLWRVYPHFPAGSDWLLLFLALGSFVHFSFLPLLWREVERDMGYLRRNEVTAGGAEAGIWLCVVSLGCLLFALWFFQTPGGQTLLSGRLLMGRPIVEPMRTGAHVASVVGFLVLNAVLAAIAEKAKALGASMHRTQAFARRGFLEAWAGGGVYFQKTLTKGVERADAGGAITAQVAFLGLLGVFYWRWSAASVLLMYSFMVTMIIGEAARLIFVAILHRRTFG